MTQSPAPFDYKLRVSSRARHVRLRVKAYLGLEIIIPKRFPRKQIPVLLREHEKWITQQLHKHQKSLRPIDLPYTLELPYLDEIFRIEYHPDKSRLSVFKDLLKIPRDSHVLAVNHLRRWIRRRAQETLPPYLATIADEFGFNYSKTIIRSQKSRWGSCSSSGTISLNDQLLFLPRDTVRYLMIHELCHTRFMNHSRDYWQLVYQCCPEHRTHEQVLNRGKDHVPGWFLQSLHQ